MRFRPAVFNRADGQVSFTGLAADNRGGWEIGFIQAEWVETNWAMYRGQHGADGSLFLQRGRAPARAQQACRDTLNGVNTYFTKSTSPTEHKLLPGPANPFPLTVVVVAQDRPGDAYLLVEQNDHTHRPNYLDEVQLEFMFCTVLTVRDPTGRFHHQAHFYWNLRWQFRFDPLRYPPGPNAADWRITPLPDGNGAPRDIRFAGLLTTPQVNSCNNLADQAFHAVETPGNACRHAYADRDHLPDVRR
jgi:hypothetical protein